MELSKGMFNEDKPKYPEKIVQRKIFANIAKSKDIYEGRGYRFQFPDDDDMQLAVFRFGGVLHSLDNICPHRHAERIFEAIISKEGTITCPLHFWTYELATGMNVNQKQGIKNLRKYEIFEEDGEVWAEKPPFKPPKWRDTQN